MQGGIGYVSLWIVLKRNLFYTVQNMDNSQKESKAKYHFGVIQGIGCITNGLRFIDFLMDNFNPKWREPLPPIPCQICGGTDHKTRFAPKQK